METSKMFKWTNLIDVVEVAPFLRPIAVTESMAVLREACKHDDHNTALFPYQLPKVCCRGVQRALCCDVCRVSGVVVRLKGTRIISLPKSEYE